MLVVLDYNSDSDWWMMCVHLQITATYRIHYIYWLSRSHPSLWLVPNRSQWWSQDSWCSSHTCNMVTAVGKCWYRKCILMTIEVREIATYYLIGIHIDNHNVTDPRQIWHDLQGKQKCRIATVGQVIQTIWNILLILSKGLHKYVVTQKLPLL